MELTAQEYVAKHPKTYLTKALIAHNIEGRIIVTSGLEAPKNPRSKLHKALQIDGALGYVVGGGAGKNASDGYVFAIYFNN